MKLTRLRLIGFKSFVEPADFLIEPGLTGVVGPNGCGKSNLVEALRWVMGESSHKAMRAADMDDVIFSGSGGRPARNTAEVGLTIDNSDRTAPAALNEHDVLEISRRIEREAGSTYRVNGREVRARDVQILFADASTGARSPALVHQGRVGEIINAKPQARRRVLEEAAGISGLHARRHEAELRLRAAEQNLQRLEDVIAQLATQIDGLKRQARQAVRYRAVAAEIRKAEATLFHLRWVGVQAEVAESDQAKDTAVRLVAERTGVQAVAATQQATIAATLPGLREAEARAAAALQRLVMARDTLEREETRARDRIAELDARLVQLKDDLVRERERAADAEAALARLAEEEAGLVRDTTATAERRINVDESVANAEAALAAVEKTFGELTGALADLTARRNQLERAVREHSERLARLDGEVAGVETDLRTVEQEAQGRPDVAALAAEVDLAQAAVGAADAEVLRAEAAHSAAQQALDATQGPCAAAERRVQRLDTEARTLAKLLDLETQNLWPPVIDLLAVEKGYETALGAALGDDLQAPIDPAAPMRWAGAMIDAADASLPEGVEPLARYVTAPAELARRLAQVGVTERSEGARLAGMLKPGQRLVSREGDLWRWDGFAAAANAQTAAARRLASRNRLTEIETELVQARGEAAKQRTALDAAEAASQTAAAAQAQARARWREAREAADAARDGHAAAERAESRFFAKLAALTEAKARLETSREETLAARQEAADALAALAASTMLESELAVVREEVGRSRTALAEARAEAQALSREAELAERRLAAIAQDRRAWHQRREAAGAQMATLQARQDETERERVSLEEAPAQFVEKRRSLMAEVEAAEANRRAAADTLAAAETALSEADRAARAALEAVGEAREQVARAEERFEGAKRRRTEIAREIVEILEVEPDQVARLAGIEPNRPLPDLEALESTLERLRRDRERLGAVNLRADEELKEVETQHGTLTGERDDLIEAIKRLRHGIQSLNREARERLTASFEVVNGQFQRLFTTLFGGGNAELQLIDHEDPLEAGLEILAKPPGKKPQTLSLLSGGEQALTALALIFAVFLTNPAPICVLDEVDAPLDDHNVERFCDLLDEMTRSTDTRFVIITHNPITMARMSRLFGVTMAERGVSQLVSVDLESAVTMSEAV